MREKDVVVVDVFVVMLCSRHCVCESGFCKSSAKTQLENLSLFLQIKTAKNETCSISIFSGYYKVY